MILVQAAIQAVQRRSALSQRKSERRQRRHNIELRAATLAGINLATPKEILYLVAAMM